MEGAGYSGPLGSWQWSSQCVSQGLRNDWLVQQPQGLLVMVLQQDNPLLLSLQLAGAIAVGAASDGPSDAEPTAAAGDLGAGASKIVVGRVGARGEGKAKSYS